ncbi:hypothetical protein GC163_05250 [bacterium]|nr:hypothetical protein [bacterium]
MALVQHESVVFDLWDLMNRCLGKPELVTRVLKKFEVQLAGDLDRISAALNSENYAVAREVAHRLKGAAANVAAHSLQEQAHALESAIQLGLEDQYGIVMHGLLREQERFVEAIKQIQLS